MTVDTWLWIGMIAMAIGSVLLFFPMQKNRSPSEEGDAIAHFMVPVIAMTLYLLMALGHGSILLHSGRTFYYGRYIDWSITTPLLLLSLTSSARKGHTIKRGAITAGLVGADVYMILTGLAAGWTDDPSLKWALYILSCLAFLFIYGMLWGPFKRLANTSPEGAQYARKAGVLSIIWFAYPVVFLLGQEGLRLWNPLTDAVLFTCLDIAAKVIYGLWAVSMLKSHESVSTALPGGGTPVPTMR